jgi:hypothetical protein
MIDLQKMTRHLGNVKSSMALPRHCSLTRCSCWADKSFFTGLCAITFHVDIIWISPFFGDSKTVGNKWYIFTGSIMMIIHQAELESSTWNKVIWGGSPLESITHGGDLLRSS